MKRIPYYLVLVVLFLACGEDEKENTDAFITNIELVSSNVEGLQFENVITDNENGIVRIIPNMPIPKDIDSIKIAVNIVLSDGAELSKELSNLSIGSADDEIALTVIAENADSKDWVIQFIGNQLPNAHFEYWHEVVGMDSKPYWEPGSNENSLWATANFGTSTYGIYGTIKFPEGDGTQVKIVTHKTSTIPILAGTIFTGKFSFDAAVNNPTDPKQATLMGVPFGLRPDTMRITYRYKSGEKLVQGTPNSATSIFSGFTVEQLEGTDQCHIYALLERKVGDVIIEVAKAEYSTSETNSRVKIINVPFEYNSNDTPTDISFVATSSKDGDIFKGAVESTLIIDDLEFIYAE